MAKPTWPHWADPDMEFWTPEQAICLSLDIDPDQPVPEHKRTRYAQWLRELQGAIKAKSEHLRVRNGEVRRFEFVFWASQCKEWSGLPPELLSIADLPIPEIGEPRQAPRAAEIHENRYRAVGEYAQSASFDVAELDAWAVSNRVPGSFRTLLTPDSVGADLPSARRFQPCSSLLVLIASEFVPADMEPHEAQAQLLTAGDTGEYPSPVSRLRDLIMGRYERLLLNAVYDGDLNLYDTLTYTKIDVSAGRRRYEVQSELPMPDESRQPTGRKPVGPVSAPPSAPVQFILHSGSYARASAGEIVLPANTTNVPVNVVIGLTVSAATIQFPNYVNVYEREGIDASDAGDVKFEHVDGRDEAERLAFRDFPAACQAIGIRPRNPYSPYADDYAGTPEQNVFYELSIGELRKYAEPYGVTVRLEGAPSVAHISDDASTQRGTDAQSDLGPGGGWQERARIIADEFFDCDTAHSCRDSLKGYAARVMEEMQKRKIHGPRGRIDNPNTIQREALQGDKWWAGKGK
ncbi:hypothetical protein WI77_10285 [Burkholderia ubonensis]|nr:hypothetical protein WI77_10285 [Burkholderia ubonensis]